MIAAPRPKIRKRFLAIAIPGLGALVAALSVSFLGSTGAVSPSVSSGTTSTNFVYSVANGNSLPTGVTQLKYTTSMSSVTSPSWTPLAQAAGSVTTAGDLAVVDASTTNLGTEAGLTVSMYMTNLASLQLDYSSIALPVNVYQCQSSCSSPSAWTQATGISTTYLTSTTGYLSWNLPANEYYDIVVETGGSFYCTATTSADLSPAYYFTAQPY